MADTIPGASPILQSALTKLGATPEMDTAHHTKAAFDGLSRKTKVPANVLMALDEADGGRGDIAKAEANALRFSEAMAQGGSLDAAMLAYAGGDSDRAKALMDRSYDIADAIYPQRTPPVEESGTGLLGRTAGFVADTGKALVGRGVQAAGGIPRAAGAFLDEKLKSAIENYGSRTVGKYRGEDVEGETFVRPVGRAAGDAVQAGGEAILDTMSDEGKEAMAGFSPTGELLSPGTWDLGENPSLGGAVLNVAGGVGSMLPLLATRNPYVAAMTGGLMAGGEGADNGRQFVIDAASTLDDDGQPEIAKMPEYQKLIGDGRSHEQATMELARRAESEAGFRQGIFGALGGAATNRIFRSADGWLGSGGRLARATKKGAAGFIEEGAQETAEGVASQSGIESATGADVNLAEDSFGNFLMGGLTGAGAGVGGGIIFGNGERDEAAEATSEGPDGLPAPDQPLMLPPPDGGSMGATPQLPAPESGGTIFGGGRAGTPPGDFERNMEAGPRPRRKDIRSQPAELRRGPDPASVQMPAEVDLSMGATPDAEPLALPAPNQGGTIFGGGTPGTPTGEIERNPASLPRPRDFANQPANLRPGQNAPADGSGGSMVAAPDQAALSATGAATPIPAGPIEALARSIQLPEPAPVETPAPLRFPEQKAGASIRLGDPENGQIFDAVFMGETADGARVRIAGQELDLTPEEFDMGRDAVAQIEAVQKAQADAEKAASSLRQEPSAQAATDPAAAPEPTARAPRIEDATSARDQDLMSRLDFLSAQARASGWNTATSRERAQIEAELAARNPAPIEDDALIDSADEPSVPAPQKRPFISYVGKQFGGINPTGTIAAELRHRGVTPRTAPGLFRRSGMKDLDNLVASEHPDLVGAIQADDMTGYLNPQSIVDAIVDEVAGTPLAFGRHAQDQSAARQADADRRERRIGAPAARRALPDQTGGDVIDRDMDISTDAERISIISSAVDAEITSLGLDGILTAADRSAIIDRLDREGGFIPDAVYDQVVRSAEDGIRETAGDGRAADALADIPFGDDGESFAGNRPDSEGRADAESEDPFGAEPSEGGNSDPAARDDRLRQAEPEAAPATEAGADGKPQTVIPGAERSEAQAQQASADRAQLEMQARQQQSKIRREGGNSGDAGPLFDTQGDMFGGAGPSAVNAPAPKATEAAAQADPEPTEAQKEAGNYRKGHMAWSGLDLTIENAKGSTRSGKDSKGNEWSVTMPAHYGYFKGTEGADGDHVDFYMGDVETSDYVLIVDQVHADTGKFDEHKVIIGTTARGAALDLYREGFADGRGDDRIGAITETTVETLKAWLEGGQMRRPAAGTLNYPFKKRGQEATDTDAEAQPAQSSSGKIEDFGQKLGGARKDTWTAYADRMADAEGVDVAAEPLSKSWPAPDYEKLIADGVEPWKVDLIRVTRDAIPTKPQKGWKLKGWVENVTLLRDFANKIMDGRYERADIKRVLGTDNKIMGQLDLYEAVGHGQSLKGIQLSAGSYSMYGGVRYSPNKVIWEVSVKAKATAFSNMPKTLAKGDTKEEAIEAFKKVYDRLGEKTDKAAKGPKFLIYAHDGRKYFTVGVKVGSNYIQLRRTDDVKEARRIIAEESEALADQLAKMREIPADRRSENAPRVGIDHRMGADITPEQFGEAFGFRGVEFGNWVEGKRRQQDLNNAYDALMDLAGILDIPAKAISLNGTLGLAFGARGTGGVSPAAAHYEPGKVVINLTKMQGAGSLAHEWFHAIDNYFGKAVESRMGKPGGLTYVSDNITPGHHVAGVRPEVIDAFISLRQSIGKTKLKERSSKIDKMRHKPYWGTGIEMHARAFESYAIAKLQDQSGSNDYLVNTVNGASWAMQAELSGLGDSYPYLKDDEIDVVRPAFEALFETLANRETDQGIELYQRDMGRNGAPVATLSGDELGDWSDVRQLGKKASAWYRSNLVGAAPVTNLETGWSIKFDGTGARKIGGRKGDVLYRMVPALPDILTNGHLVSSEPDNLGRAEVRSVHKFTATVSLDGREYRVIATVREKVDGTYHYDLSMDRGASGFSTATVQEQRSRTSALEGGPADLNLDLSGLEINGGVSAEALPDAAKTVSAILKAHGIDRKVSPRVVRGLSSAAGVPVLGSYRGGEITVNADAANPAHVTRHEIIHALRDKGLWGNDYGLFSQAEWQALAKAARADRSIREAVKTAYPDLTTAQQTEEMIAEAYADWATERANNPPGALGRALERIQSMFRAMAAALRGEGFVDAAAIMRRIAKGDIGGRGPEGGPGKGSDTEKLQRGPVRLSPAVIGDERRSLSRLADYAAAKAGDVAAAVRVAQSVVTSDLVERVRVAIGDKRPIVIPVVSEDAAGRNKIPRAAAELLSSRLGLAAGTGIVQSTAQRRTALSGLDRIFAAPEFAGPVSEGRDYLILDDTLTQGATFAALASHIEAGGGNVLASVALTGKQYSAILTPSNSTLAALREKYGDLENDFILATGYGFDSLTESEARYLTNFKPPHIVRDRILEEGRRGSSDRNSPDIGPEPRYQRNLSDLKQRLSKSKGSALGMVGNLHWKRSPQALSGIFSNLLTDAMGRNQRFNLLGAVPGRPLFTELGKNLAAAQEYLGLKEKMDAERNEWQSLSAETVDKWSAAARKHPDANARLMELMHDTTISQIDPSRADGWTHPVDQEAAEVLKMKAASKERKEWAEGVLKDAEARKAAYPAFKARYDRLPKPMRDMYEEVRDAYSKLADAEEEAVMENIKQGIKATLEQARRDHKKERQRINDEMDLGAERTEALGKANKRLSEAEARAARTSGPWLRQLRQVFESNRIAGPYFPLTRQGEYFVAVRDQEGNLIEFQRFETAEAQGKFAAEQAKDPELRIRRGVVDNGAEIREAADPRFVADVEKLLAETGASKEAMDAVWQKYLETMPGQSMRKSRIHRKGTRGYNADAMRAFASGMFHGSHQVARLRFGTQMTESLAVAKEQAAEQKDPNRAGFVVREMEKRHAFAMNPTNNPLVTAGTSAAFVWYLAASPAAAIVNATQTTVVGVPLMRAHYKKAGTNGVIKALTKASHDFVKGRGKVTKRVAGVPIMSETWSVENAPGLTADERLAMTEGYERGVIDKTQAHDLAAVAESGVTYNPTREKVMRIIGWGFHHTERFNREVTYLAAYRLARDQGMKHDEATRDAGRVTWNVHFDYSNTSRPRMMQGDALKLLLIFRNFSVNMLYRLFRDTHQALNGADAETRSEARNQLIGVTLSMMTHAGIRGVWGYGILMMMLGLFFPGGGDDADEWLQDVLLMEGDDIGTAAWNWTMGLALNGAPGHALGMNLTERIGMPNLWFRGSDRDLEGSDIWAHYMGELAGPLFSIPGSAIIGTGQMLDGHYLRGLEKMTPVFMRNPIKTARYLNEGVTTVNGDPLVDGLNPWQVFIQANGFTPAEVAERYKINTRLKNNERRVEDRRKGIIREIGEAVRAGQEIPEKAVERMRGFNMDYPEWAITADSIRQSVRSRERASQRQEYGATLNPKLNERLRREAAPALYN